MNPPRGFGVAVYGAGICAEYSRGCRIEKQLTWKPSGRTIGLPPARRSRGERGGQACARRGRD